MLNLFFKTLLPIGRVLQELFKIHMMKTTEYS